MKYKRIEHVPLFIFVSSVVLMLISFQNQSEIFTRVFSYVFDTEARTFQISEMLRQTYEHSGVLSFIKFWMSSYSYDEMMVFGFSSFQVALVVFSCLPSIYYFDAFRNEMQFILHKGKSYSRQVLKSSFAYAIHIAIPIFIAFVCFNILYSTLPSYYEISGIYLEKNLFIDWFGAEFYQNNHVAYYLLEGVFKFFIYPVLLSMLASILSLSLTRKHYSFLIVCICYFGLSSLSGILYNSIGVLAFYLDPSIVLNSSSVFGLSSLGILLPILVVVILLFFTYSWVVNHREI